MRHSDNPAARPRTTIVPQQAPTLTAEQTAPVFRAEVSPERLAEIAAIPDDDIDTSDIPDGSENLAAHLNLGGGVNDTNFASPQPTREPIGSAPQNGDVILAFWGPDDQTGRMVRWRQGRHFNNRRWVSGGTWQPADGMLPLPAAPPTEWLKDPDRPEPEPEGEDQAEAAD